MLRHTLVPCLLALALAGAFAETPAQPGDTITARGVVTSELMLNSTMAQPRHGTIELTNTKTGELGQALRFLAGERIVVEAEYKGTEALLDDEGLLREVRTRLRVTAIVSPSYSKSLEGVVLFRGGVAKLHLYENGALQPRGYLVKNVPQQVMINLRNVRLRFSAFVFADELHPELKLHSLRTKVRLPGFLSDDELAKVSGEAGLKPGDDVSLRLSSLKIWKRGQPELGEFIDWARPEEFRPVDREQGEFLFGEVKTRDKRQGFYPLWKLWLGRSTKHGEAGPGVVGALGDPTQGFDAKDVEKRILDYLKGVHEEHVTSAYEWAFDEADDQDEVDALKESLEEDLAAFEHHANADGDHEPFDGWIDEADWAEDYGVQAKDVAVYALSWYTAPEGIGLSQYFAFNTKTGELLTESDIWD